MTARRLLALAVASQASISIVQWGIAALAPALTRRFDLSPAPLGVLLSANAVGNALMLVPAGGLVDRVGPRLPLVAGGLGAGAALLAGALAPNAWLLGGALVLSGAIGSLISVAGTVSIFHGFPADRRGAALGVRQMSISLGGLLAAVLLPSLAAVGGVSLALAAVGVAAAVCSVAFGLASPPGALVEGAATRRFAPRAVFLVPGMPRLMLVGLLYVAVLTTALTFAVPALDAEGASDVATSALFAVISVAAITARLTWGRVADRGGGTRRRETLRDIGLLSAAGALVYWAASQAGPAVALPAMALFAFGALGFNGVLYLIAGELAGAARAGQAVGIASAVLFGGGALAALPLGLLAEAAGYDALWPAAAVLALAGVAVTLGLPGARERERDVGQPVRRAASRRTA